MKKIDAHAHLIGNICGIGSEGELRPLGEGKAQYASGKIIQLIPKEYGDTSLTPETLIEVMNKNDVEFSVCLQGNYAGFQNIYTYESALKYPTKIIPAATYDPYFSNMNKVRSHLFDELKIKIIKIEASNTSGLMANHPAIDLAGNTMDDVFKHANERKLIFYLDIGRPGNCCYQIEQVKKIADKYPSMKFIICHLAAPQHNQLELLITNLNKLKSDNLYFDIAALPNNSKQPYPFHEAISYIKTAISIIGSDKIIWGSDFPSAMNFSSYEESYKYIEDSNMLTEEEKKKILYDNAYRLFGELI